MLKLKSWSILLQNKLSFIANSSPFINLFLLQHAIVLNTEPYLLCFVSLVSHWDFSLFVLCVLTDREDQSILCT